MKIERATSMAVPKLETGQDKKKANRANPKLSRYHSRELKADLVVWNLLEGMSIENLSMLIYNNYNVKELFRMTLTSSFGENSFIFSIYLATLDSQILNYCLFLFLYSDLSTTVDIFSTFTCPFKN